MHTIDLPTKITSYNSFKIKSTNITNAITSRFIESLSPQEKKKELSYYIMGKEI